MDNTSKTTLANWVKNMPKIEYDGKNGFYQLRQIDEALIRLKKFLVENDVVLCPAQEKKVEDFEKKHQIVLPLAYRRFIIEVTDGIDKGKTFSLPKLIDKECEGNLSKPFPLKNFWHAEGDSKLQENKELFESALDEVNNCGQISLDFDEGLWSLIVSGECYGEVWNVGNWNIWFFSSMLFPRRDFLSWYEWCIEKKLDINNGNEVSDATNEYIPGNFWEKYGEYNRS